MLEWLRRTRSAGPSASRRAALQPALPHSKEGTEESGDEGPAASREVRALRAIATLVTATARLARLVGGSFTSHTFKTSILLPSPL